MFVPIMIMRNLLYPIVLVFVLLASCNSESNKAYFGSHVENGTIRIQPFVGFSPSLLEYSVSELSKYSFNVVVLEPIPLPNSCLNTSKTRYKADSLLVFLKAKTPKNSITIGFTNKKTLALQKKIIRGVWSKTKAIGVFLDWATGQGMLA